MLVANDGYSDSCTDTADIGSYDSTIAGVVSAVSIAAAQVRADNIAHSCAYTCAHSCTYSGTNGRTDLCADNSAYCTDCGAYPGAYQCADGSTDHQPLRCWHALLLG